MHATTGNDQWLFCRLDRRNRGVNLVKVCTRAHLFPCFLHKEVFWPIIGFCLNILTERQCDRTTLHRISQYGHRTRQGGQKLFRAGDPVKITTDRFKAVIGRNRTIAKIFYLLQNRVWCAIGKHITGHKKNRQTVHMRQCRSGYHVGRPRPDRGRHRHRTFAIGCLGIGNGGMRHALLVMTAPCRKLIANTVQGLAKPRDIAMPENGPAPAKEGIAITVYLTTKVPHHCLGGG